MNNDWKERALRAEAERDRWEHVVTQVEAERDAAVRALARAESAEAALAGLREGIEALDDEWALTKFPDERTAMILRADLRRLIEAAALAPTPDREEER